MKSKVVIVRCDSYDEEKVYQALCTGIQALGGIGQFVKQDEKILVKPNFLSAADPEKAVITHPSVIGGMLRILQENGFADVSCGDSPGHGSQEGVGAKFGFKELLAKYGAKEAEVSTEVSVEYPQGVTAKQFYLTKAAVEADAIINLCKMKTHALERITGAVKNYYGLICGYRKAAGHVKYPNPGLFARMLVDLHKAVNSRLHIMDGIVAMEGNGPGSGTPVKMNLLMFSTDPVAIDAVFCKLINLDPDSVPTNVQSEKLGLGNYHEENIELIEAFAEGADRENDGTGTFAALRQESMSFDQAAEKFGKPDFDVDREGVKKSMITRITNVATVFGKYPYIEGGKCVKCGICVDHCPVPGKAVDFTAGRDKAPVYNYDKCIRCYCCQEMCPQHAIFVRRM